MAFSSVSAPHFVFLFPPMGILFPLLRRTKISILGSFYFMSFIWPVNGTLSIPSFWAKIRLSVSVYHVCSFVIELCHSGWYPPDPFICQWIYEILRQMNGSGGYHPEWVNPITKEHTWYALTDKWILAQKSRIPKIHFAKHMKLKKKEDQSVDTSFLLRIGNKIPIEGVAETMFGDETKGWTIQRLPHPGIHPIISHK